MVVNDLDKKFYKISDVAEILGVPASTLRFWEKQFTIIKPRRNAKNIRFYTPQDIETIRKVYYLVKEKGLKLEQATLEMCGTCDKVTISKDDTIIAGGAGSKDAIADRVIAIKKEIENSTSSYDKEKLQERLAKLAGGVAVLYIGANSEVEMKEKKDRVDDDI